MNFPETTTGRSAVGQRKSRVIVCPIPAILSSTSSLVIDELALTVTITVPLPDPVSTPAPVWLVVVTETQLTVEGTSTLQAPTAVTVTA